MLIQTVFSLNAGNAAAKPVGATTVFIVRCERILGARFGDAVKVSKAV